MVPILVGLILDVSAKYTAPYTFSFNSSKNIFEMSCGK
jgi:hypothetical protein